MSAPSDPARLASVVDAVFGPNAETARRYAQLLCVQGVDWGLIGPREQPRLWERHILNSAAIADLLPAGASVVDVGSGAGLPGLPLALARPDLAVTLLEPLARRVDFLGLAVATLNLGERVQVIRGRTDTPDLGRFDVVTARAVAPLSKLVSWCLPLLAEGGTLVAIKGAQAEDEIADARSALKRRRMTARVVEVRLADWDESARAVVVAASRPAERP